MEILVAPNGETEIIIDDKDLIEFIGKNMGFEVQKMIEEIVKKSDKAQLLADTDFKSYEMQVEENHSAFEDLAGLIEKASSELSKERMSKKTIKSLIDKMETIVGNQL